MSGTPPQGGAAFLSARREASWDHYRPSQTRLNLARMRRPLFRLIAALALTPAACVQQPTPAPDAPPLVPTGEIPRADHQTYRCLLYPSDAAHQLTRERHEGRRCLQKKHNT